MIFRERKAFCLTLYKFLLLLFSVLFFALQHPNPLWQKGLSFLGWISYVPLFILISILSVKECLLYGFLYGFFSYGTFGFWLLNYDPITYFSVCFAYGIFFVLLFLLFKASILVFPKNGYILQWIIFCGFEYFKTMGFWGLNYGLTCYSQWNNLCLLQCTQFLGCWLLSYLLIFSSALISNVFIQKSLKRNTCAIVIFLCVVSSLFLYGKIELNEQKGKMPIKVIKVCAVQDNVDSEDNEFSDYEESLSVLMKLSEKAVQEEPDIDLVVWPETAVVPSVVYNYENPYDTERRIFVKRFLDFADSFNKDLIIGNGHRERIGDEIFDYNSTLYFQAGKNLFPPMPDIYKKQHLVPFGEYFPIKFGKENCDVWIPGKGVNNFSVKGISVCTPICFEDTFGFLIAEMRRKNAAMIVNVSDDSWSGSKVSQMQHLSMSVFRSAENSMPSVRSCANGISCIIDSSGKVVESIPSFTEGYVIGCVPVTENKMTLYSRVGDVLGKIFFVVALLWTFALISIIIFRINFRNRKFQ